jgi:hypothetical protein
MPKKQKSNWMEDGDDAHFSDNPSSKAKAKKKGFAKKYAVKK